MDREKMLTAIPDWSVLPAAKSGAGDEAEGNWEWLYRLAGVGLVVSLALILVDMGMSFAGYDAAVGGLSVQEWFGMFQQNPFVGFRNLGLFNVIQTILAIPLYLALYHLHKRAFPALAALALIIFVFGTAIYCSNNRALMMLELSSQYAAASPAEQPILLAAGAVTLAQAEDFTPGTFLGFLTNSLGSLGMLVVMLRGGVFSKKLALAGVIGTSCLLVFTIRVTFAPESMAQMMPVAMVGGLLMMGWNGWMVIAMLWRTGRPGKGMGHGFTG